MRLAKFLTVGVGNTILTIAVFNVLLAASVAAPVANAIGYSIGTVNSFYWNRRWTFGDRRTAGARAAFARFLVVIGGSLVLSTVLVALLERPALALAAQSGAPRVLVLNVVEALAVLLGFIWNYVLTKNWVFPDNA